MTSSSSAIASIPAHPETAHDQSAAIGDRHPQHEGIADNEEIADQRQHGNAKADGDEGAAEPQAGENIEQHGIDRPERRHLAPSEMAEHDAAKQPEREVQHEGGRDPQIE